MADAAHIFSDVSGFIISIIALKLTNVKANSKMSYGYHRAEILGALGSVMLIWGLTIWLVVEAIHRI
jgi:zinc transporter 2